MCFAVKLASYLCIPEMHCNHKPCGCFECLKFHTHLCAWNKTRLFSPSAEIALFVGELVLFLQSGKLP